MYELVVDEICISETGMETEPKAEVGVELFNVADWNGKVVQHLLQKLVTSGMYYILDVGSYQKEALWVYMKSKIGDDP